MFLAFFVLQFLWRYQFLSFIDSFCSEIQRTWSDHNMVQTLTLNDINEWMNEFVSFLSKSVIKWCTGLNSTRKKNNSYKKRKKTIHMTRNRMLWVSSWASHLNWFFTKSECLHDMNESVPGNVQAEGMNWHPDWIILPRLTPWFLK